jgi:hypothetical protein
MLALFLAACQSGGSDDPEATQDTRVDHAGKDDTFEAEAPRMCTTGDGQVYTVWQEDRTGQPAIWFNASNDVGRSWFPSDVQVNHGEALAAAPDVGCDGQHVWVVWEDARDGDLANHNIYLNSSEDGGITWREEDLLLDGDVEGDHMSLGPRVLARGDRVYVAWFDSPDGAYDIYLQASTDAGVTWRDAAERVDSDERGAAYSAWPRLAADGAGTVVVAWEDNRSGATDIYANASHDDGGSWGADTRLDGGDEPGSANSFSPSLALDGDDAYVVWHDERSGASRDVYLNHSADGGDTWLDEASRGDSDAEGMFDSINASVSAAGGRAQVVWQDDRAGGYDIYHRVFEDGDWKWGELRLDTDVGGEAQSYFPQVLAVGDAVLAVWQDYRSDAGNVGFNDLYYNFSEDRGNHWNAQDLRVNSNAPGSSYAVDAGLGIFDGHYAVVWADGRFGSGDIFYASRAFADGSFYVAPEEDADPKAP